MVLALAGDSTMTRRRTGASGPVLLLGGTSRPSFLLRCAPLRRRHGQGDTPTAAWRTPMIRQQGTPADEWARSANSKEPFLNEGADRLHAAAAQHLGVQSEVPGQPVQQLAQRPFAVRGAEQGDPDRVDLAGPVQAG